MIDKVEYNINLTQGEDLFEQFQIVHDDTGLPFKLLSEYKLSASYASEDKRRRGSLFLSCDDLGWVTMSLPRSKTATLSEGNYDWNLEMYDLATELESDPIYGIITIMVGAKI